MGDVDVVGCVVFEWVDFVWCLCDWGGVGDDGVVKDGIIGEVGIE